MKLIGIERKTGNYQGFDYDNAMLYCTEPMKGDNKTGTKCFTYKCKYVKYLESGAKVGDEIVIAYDRFGNVLSIGVEV